jgi:preprotein translocase subunit SecD
MGRPAGVLILVLGVLASACGGSDSPTADASALQLRRVRDVVPRTSPEWDTTDLTCPGDAVAGCLAAASTEPVVVLGAEGEKYLLGPVVVDGSDAEEATARQGTPASTGWSVNVQLSEEGSEALASATRASVGDRIAIVVDGLVVSAPTVAEPITAGAVVVAGGLSENEAERLASSLGG